MTNNTTGKTLADIAITAAINAVAADDSAAYKGTVSVSLLMASRIIDKLEGGETDAPLSEMAASENKKVFTVLIKRVAMRGGMVWRNTQPIVDKFMALKGKDRETAVSHYVDGGKKADALYAKPEGAKLSEGLAKLRTWSYRLVDDVVTNHADKVREILAKKAAGASGDALSEVWNEFVRTTYGKTFAALTDKVRPDAAVKNETSELDKLFKKACDLPELQLNLLIAKLEGFRLERANIAAELDDTMNADTPADAPAEAPAMSEAA